MRTFMIAALATAGLGSTSVIAAPAPAAPQGPVAQAVEPLAAYAQYPGGFRTPNPHFAGRGYGYYGRPSYGGPYYGRPYYGRHYYGRPYAGRYYRRGYGGAAAAGIAGLATGAIIGGVLAQQAAPTYVVPNGGGDAYCAQRYRSYDPASGTYLGYDGLRHPCP
jgi:hypothetical protein